MAEKRYSFNQERGHPNFWDNHCDLADCYLTCEDVVKRLNELNDENKNLSKLNKILEGFLLDKGYDFKDIIKFVQERTDEKR